MPTCEHCRQDQTRAGHDPCISDLPGVHFACCGHGGGPSFSQGAPIPYLVERHATLYGQRALDRMRELGGAPPEITMEEIIQNVDDEERRDKIREFLARHEREIAA